MMMYRGEGGRGKFEEDSVRPADLLTSFILSGEVMVWQIWKVSLRK